MPHKKFIGSVFLIIPNIRRIALNPENSFFHLRKVKMTGRGCQRYGNDMCRQKKNCSHIEYAHLAVKFPMEPVVTQDTRLRCCCCCSFELILQPNGGECSPSGGDDVFFFHGWNPFPIAASANGGGDLFDNLLHWAASMASGVLLTFECSCK